MAHKGKSGAPLDLVLLDGATEGTIVDTLGKHLGTNEICQCVHQARQYTRRGLLGGL